MYQRFGLVGWVGHQPKALVFDNLTILRITPFLSNFRMSFNAIRIKSFTCLCTVFIEKIMSGDVA